jgi:phosphorylated adapter RNA export protein
MGLEFAQAILQETLTIESQGGMMIQLGTRRRTPGGVFLYLARNKLSSYVRWAIFHPVTDAQKKKAKKARKKLAKQEQKLEATQQPSEPGT